MALIGLFYGSDEGNTEGVAKLIKGGFGGDMVDIHNISDVEPSDFEPYDHIIIGTSTWDDGQLQSDWEFFFEHIYGIDFSNKVVAFFGLGDQLGYGQFYLDAMGILHDAVAITGPKIVGRWPVSDEYEHEESKALTVDREYFVGLALDQDTQKDLTADRVTKWVEQLKIEFGLIEQEGAA